MYIGIRSTPHASSYADALRLYEKYSRTPTGRARKPKDGGMQFASKATRIRQESNGDIVMRLWDTDCVTWHPDNSFTVEPWESVTTGGFISSLTPLSVGRTMVATYFRLPLDDKHSNWRERWATSRVCYAEGTFHEVDGGYAPDEDTLRTFRYPIVDRKMTREASKAHHFVDFETWLAVAPHHLDLKHEGEDMQAVSDALQRRDFQTAAVHLPTTEVPRGFGIAERIKPIPMSGPHWQHPVTMSSIQRFRRWLYDDIGAVELAECKTMTCGEYERRIKEINAFDKAGASLHRAGFSFY